MRAELLDFLQPLMRIADVDVIVGIAPVNEDHVLSGYDVPNHAFDARELSQLHVIADLEGLVLIHAFNLYM